jgi:hypothetical protein
MIETVCGRESEIYREVSTRVVDAALEGIIAYQRRTLDSCGVLPWLTHLTTLAATPEVRRRLEDTADILHGNAIAEKLPSLVEGSDGGGGEQEEFEAAYRLLVEEFVPGVDRLDLGQRARADYLANVRRALRELAHAACYQLEHFDLAARALATAAQISEGPERDSLQHERDQLLREIVRRKAKEMAAEHARASSIADVSEDISRDLLTESVDAAGAAEPADLDSDGGVGEDGTLAQEAGSAADPSNTAQGTETDGLQSDASPVQSELDLWEETGRDPDAAPINVLQMEVAGYTIDLSPDCLRFGGLAMAPADITGVRYGVVEVAAGQQVFRCHRIAWCTAVEVISLDESNVFAPDNPDAAALYRAVLDTLNVLLIPGLIGRLVDLVQRGGAVPLGNALLRSDGLIFHGPRFNWPSNKAVPYSELSHAFADGEFIVFRPGRETDAVRFASSTVWNAVIAGHVIDALANGYLPHQYL